MKIRFLLPFLWLLFSISMSAQTKGEKKYTKKEFKTFTKAYQHILDHPFDIETSMKRGVKALGLSEKRMEEILQAQFLGENIKLSSVETLQLRKLEMMITKDKELYDNKINKFLEDSNIKPSKYRAIEKQYYASKALQAEARKLSK